MTTDFMKDIVSDLKLDIDPDQMDNMMGQIHGTEKKEGEEKKDDEKDPKKWHKKIISNSKAVFSAFINNFYKSKNYYPEICQTKSKLFMITTCLFFYQNVLLRNL